MTDKLVDATADLSTLAPIVILRLRNMTAIDATGLHALEALSDRLTQSGRSLVLCGARQQPAQFLHQAEFVEHVGAKNIVPHVKAALARAREIQSASHFLDGPPAWRTKSPGSRTGASAGASDDQPG
jgi:SulP family sulfate permease